MKTVLSSYNTPLLKNAPIIIKLEEKEYKTRTNHKAIFELEFDYAIENEPKIVILFQDKKLEIQQDYPIYFKSSESKLGIISDIDDTILVSYTSNIIKRIGVLSLVPPKKRKTVDFTQELLSLVSKYKSNVFYVSKSESNLFELLSKFIIHHQLPKGVLFLTPYLSFKQLLKRKKGKDFKLNKILFILNNSVNKKFILFGDDTQKDMEVYRIIANTHRKSIARIYIRQTKKKVNRRQRILWNNLKESFSKSVYFNETTSVTEELKKIEKLYLIKTV
jgi:phosphatidate phosphatase APP1